MLDQTFTLKNLQEIYDKENRKGIDIASRYFPAVAAANESLRKVRNRRRELLRKRSLVSEGYFKRKMKQYDERIEALLSRRQGLIDTELTKIGVLLSATGAPLNLTKVTVPGVKTVYSVSPDPNSLFAIKHLQTVMSRLYKLRPADRNQIISQIKCLLGDDFPKIVIRTDIKDFFESIPRQHLLDKIEHDTLLSHSLRNIVRSVLRNYTALSGEPNGVPRGIGVSSYLAELYMRQIDERIRDSPHIIYYARYVDDIIAIYAPPPGADLSAYMSDITSVTSKYNLRINNTKTRVLDLTKPLTDNFTYLGYMFHFDDKTFRVTISDSRVKRYRKRLKLAFADYKIKSASDKRAATALLYRRIRFLTANTRLLSNKKAARVGVYYSNQHITDMSDLESLDVYLRWLATRTKQPWIVRRVGKYSFVKGFEEQRHCKFTLRQMSNIAEVWRHA